VISCGHFTAELLGENDDILVCQPLGCECDSGCQCWPKRVRGNVPWQEGTRRLRIWEKDRLIHEEEIPDSHELKIRETKTQPEGVLIKWSVADPSRKHSGEELWYVVHWYDEEDEVWRGVAPRQQETSLVIPKSLFRAPKLRVRVLVTSGIATGYIEETVTLDDHTASVGTIMLVGHDPSTAGAQPYKRSVLHAIAVDSTGRQVPGDFVVWYDTSGVEIGRGSHLDVRSLPHGRQGVRAVVRDPSGRHSAKNWSIEHHPGGVVVHHESPGWTSGEGPQHKHPHKR
jgi:hypothetical protein